MRDVTINEVAKHLPVVLKEGGYFAFAANGHDPKRAPGRLPCLYVHPEQPVTKELLKVKEPDLDLKSYACGVVVIRDGQITFRLVKPSSKAITLDQLKTQLKAFPEAVKASENKKVRTLLRGKLPAFLQQPRCEETDRYLVAEKLALEVEDAASEQMKRLQADSSLVSDDEKAAFRRLQGDYEDLVGMLTAWRGRWQGGIEAGQLGQAREELDTIRTGIGVYEGHDLPEQHNAWFEEHRAQVALLRKRLQVASRHLGETERRLQAAADLPELLERGAVVRDKLDPATGKPWTHAARLAELGAILPRLDEISAFAVGAEAKQLSQLGSKLRALEQIARALLQAEQALEAHEAAVRHLVAGKGPDGGPLPADTALYEVITEELTWLEAKGARVPGPRGRDLAELVAPLRALQAEVLERLHEAAGEVLAPAIMDTAESLGQLSGLAGRTPAVDELAAILAPLPGRMKAQTRALQQPHPDPESLDLLLTQSVNLTEQIYAAVLRFMAVGDAADARDPGRLALTRSARVQELFTSTCEALGGLLIALLAQDLDDDARRIVVEGGRATIAHLDSRFVEGAAAGGGDWIGSLGRANTGLAKLRVSYTRALGQAVAEELTGGVVELLEQSDPKLMGQILIKTDDAEAAAIKAEMSELVLAELARLQPHKVHGIGKKKQAAKAAVDKQRRWLRSLVEGVVQDSLPTGVELTEHRTSLPSLGVLLAKVLTRLEQAGSSGTAEIPGASEAFLAGQVDALLALKEPAPDDPEGWRGQCRVVVEAELRAGHSLSLQDLAKELLRAGLLSPEELAASLQGKEARARQQRAQAASLVVNRSAKWQAANQAQGKQLALQHARENQDNLVLIQDTFKAFVDPLLAPGGWRKVPPAVRRLCVASVDDLEAAGVQGRQRFTGVRDQIFLRWLNPQLARLAGKLRHPGRGRVAQDASRLVLSAALGTQVKTAELLSLQGLVSRYQPRFDTFLEDLVEGTRREL